MTDLKQLAIDVVEGRVFGSWMLPEQDQHLIAAIFLPLAFKDASGKLPDDVWGVYEYHDKAKKQKVRDYPGFTTCKFLTQQDCDKLIPLIHHYTDFKSLFLATDVGLPDAVAQSNP
jgi:hypothetical protein